MERITRADVERLAASVSEGMPGHKVYAQARNGYLGLDLYRHEVNGARAHWTMVDTLHAGTKREVYTYLQGMRRAQLLAR
jgi:hypothetical protein